MAVPTISSVSPGAGHTGGKTLVAIEGTGFRLPTPQVAVAGVVPEAPPSVRVAFGDGIATAVHVLSSTLLYAVTPIHDPTDAIDVVVTNLADNGDAIPGESATRADAWRFVRPNVTDGDSDLVRLIDAFRRELWRQVTPHVSWPEHTDFDRDTGDSLSITEVPEFPGLIIAATALEENAFYSVRGPVDVPDPEDPDGFVSLEAPTTVDVVFTLVGVSDSAKEVINLAAVLRRFFKKNPYLEMARDPDDAGKGTVRYEMDAQDAPDVKLSIEANSDNLRTFAVTARVRGFDIEDMFGIREADGTKAEGPRGAGESAVEAGVKLEDPAALTIEPL